MSIDHELRDALRREAAPADLADRVLARLERPSQPVPRAGSSGILRWLAAAAVLALTAGVAERYYTEQRQEAEAARVREEIRIALQITSEKLALVQQKIEEPVTGEDR